jgi:hypothetical protein
MINLLVELRSCYGSIEPVASPFLWGPMEHIQRNRLLSYSEIETMGALWGFAVKPFAVPIFHLGSPRKTDPTKYQISFGKLRKKLFFGGLGGVRFPGPSKVANCHLPYCLPRHVLYGSFFEISPFKLLWAQTQNLLETHFKK